MTRILTDPCEKQLTKTVIERTVMQEHSQGCADSGASRPGRIPPDRNVHLSCTIGDGFHKCLVLDNVSMNISQRFLHYRYRYSQPLNPHVGNGAWGHVVSREPILLGTRRATPRYPATR